MTLRESSPLVPAQGLPVTPFPPGGALQWLSTDTREEFLANPQPSFGESEIVYQFNQAGFRSDEFEALGEIRLLAIGCSYVLGVGLPREALFHENFAARLRGATGQSIAVWNLGLPGASNDCICRLLQLAIPLLNPDLVLVHFTHVARRDYVSVQGCWTPFFPAYEPDDWVTREIYGHFRALASPYDDDANFYRNYRAIESLLSGREWLYSLTRSEDLRRIWTHLDLGRQVGNLIDIDKARDGKHPGPASHAALADLYWSRFCESEGLARILARRESPAVNSSP